MTEVIAGVFAAPPATRKAAERTANTLQNTGGETARTNSMFRASVRDRQEQALIDQAIEETAPEASEERFVAATAAFLGFVAVQGTKLAIGILSLIATILFVFLIVLAGYTRKISTWAFTT